MIDTIIHNQGSDLEWREYQCGQCGLVYKTPGEAKECKHPEKSGDIKSVYILAGQDEVYTDHYAAEEASFGVVLTTEDGIQATNTIHLEPEVYRALVHFVNRMGRNIDLRD